MDLRTCSTSSVFKACYTNHYRTGLIQIIEALE
jgi:hypothetical protein